MSAETSVFTVNLFGFSHVANGLFLTSLPTSLRRSSRVTCVVVRCSPFVST